MCETERVAAADTRTGTGTGTAVILCRTPEYELIHNSRRNKRRTSVISDRTAMLPRLLLALVVHTGVIASPGTDHPQTCAPLSVQSDFNLTEYLRASWYIQRQQQNGYQPPSHLYCVVATYNETYHGKPAKVPLFRGQTFTVYNDCRNGSRAGPVCNNFTSPHFKPSFAVPLCGRVPKAEQPAKITVAPCALPNLLSGDYWVAAVGPTPSHYEWALVIAGQPTVQLSDGCTTPDTCTSPGDFRCGLWMFTRSSEPSPSVMASLMKAANEKGISTQRLLPINHTGCSYEGFEIK